MLSNRRAWWVLCAFAVFTCFAVFELPFLLPPRPLLGLSAANLAGFNSRVAVVAAACCSLFVLLFLYRRPSQHVAPGKDERPLPAVTVGLFAALYCGFTVLLGRIVLSSTSFYPSDLDYFTQQMTAHVRYGRSLYSSVEFGYGYLLFYLPLYVRSLLFALHLSIRASLVVSVVFAQLTGLCLLAYLVNRLRMTYPCRWIAFAAFGLQSCQLNLSLNYQLIRFLLPACCLVFASRRKPLWALATSLVLGQLLTFAISPEMGFSFLLGSTTLALFQFFTDRRRAFLWMALLPVGSALLFLAACSAAGGGYLRTMLLFSHGVLGLIVEPVPYILTFLFAVVWLVPWLLSRALRSSGVETPLLFALYVSALGLLPVAFGRADPTHVLLNGIAMYLLSFVAVASVKNWQRNAWVFCSTAVFLFTFLLNSRLYNEQLFATIPGLSGRPVLQNAAYVIGKISNPVLTRHYAFARKPPAVLDIGTLKRIVQGDKVIQPIPSSRLVDMQLDQAGLYEPTYYFGFDNQLDQPAEFKEQAEFNKEKWALLS